MSPRARGAIAGRLYIHMEINASINHAAGRFFICVAPPQSARLLALGNFRRDCSETHPTVEWLFVVITLIVSEAISGPTQVLSVSFILQLSFSGCNGNFEGAF